MVSAAIIRRRRMGVPAFSPFTLFAGGEEGVWYDPSDLTTLFQDTAGTTPVTTPGQSVALMLDKSKGAPTLGPELVTNGTFDTDTSGWTASANASLSLSSNALKITAIEDGAAKVTQVTQVISGLTVGARYAFSFDVIAETQSTGNPFYGSVGLNQAITSTGSVNTYFIADATSVTIKFGLGAATLAGEYLEVDNVSVRELPGYHATQSTAAARPTYQVDAGGRGYLFDDGVDDTLNWTAPTDTDYTVSYVDTDGNVTTLTGQSLSGATNVLLDPALVGYLAIDRALTAGETNKLEKYWETLT